MHFSVAGSEEYDPLKMKSVHQLRSLLLQATTNITFLTPDFPPL